MSTLFSKSGFKGSGKIGLKECAMLSQQQDSLPNAQRQAFDFRGDRQKIENLCIAVLKARIAELKHAHRNRFTRTAWSSSSTGADQGQ